MSGKTKLHFRCKASELFECGWLNPHNQYSPRESWTSIPTLVWGDEDVSDKYYWCEQCRASQLFHRASQLFQDALYEFEIGYDGNEDAYIEGKGGSFK